MTRYGVRLWMFWFWDVWSHTPVVDQGLVVVDGSIPVGSIVFDFGAPPYQSID